MTSVTQVLKSIGPSLVLFFKAVAIYFVVFPAYEKPSLFSVIIKCLPILSLMFFVVIHGMSLGHEHRYARRILTGLIFSCIGDACLVYPNYFDLGMLSFSFAHFNYISAFGFKPLNLLLGVVLYILAAASSLVFMPGLHGIDVYAVPVYNIILITMVWRAIARVQFFEDLWTWSKLCSCAGGILFALSDSVIGIDRFVSPLEHAQVIIMSTYYAAQMGIALSVVDSKHSHSQ